MRKLKPIICVLLFCLLAAGTGIAASETTQDFLIESILVDGSIGGRIPVGYVSVNVSVRNNAEASIAELVVAAYGANGEMLCATAEEKSIAEQQTVVGNFSFDNHKGNIHTFKAFVLVKEDGYIPASTAKSVSDFSAAEQIYLNENGNVVFVFPGDKKVIADRSYNGYIKSADFSDYSVGDKFCLEYPQGEFDAYFTYGDQKYTVHFEPIYYELSYKAENVSDTEIDSDVWYIYADEFYRYRPFRQTLRIRAHTDPALKGSTLELDLIQPDNSIISVYERVDEAGNIEAEKELFYTHIPTLVFSEVSFFE